MVGTVCAVWLVSLHGIYGVYGMVYTVYTVYTVWCKDHKTIPPVYGVDARWRKAGVRPNPTGASAAPAGGGGGASPIFSPAPSDFTFALSF